MVQLVVPVVLEWVQALALIFFRPHLLPQMLKTALPGPLIPLLAGPTVVSQRLLQGVLRLKLVQTTAT